MGTFFLVRLARDDTPSPPSGVDSRAQNLPSDAARPPAPGITRPISGHDAAPPGITRPIPGQGTAVPGPESGQRSFTFEDEARDPGWADEHERELTLRMRKVVDGLTAAGTVVNVDAIECRRSLCRVTLHARDVAALSKVYGALESEQGLYGWADNILFDSVEIEDDGQVTSKVTAAFDRE